MSQFHDDFDDLDRLVLATKASVIAKLDAATDFDAVLADIYTKAAVSPRSQNPVSQERPGGDAESRSGGMDEVCDRIDMLNTVLKAVTDADENAPLMGSIQLTTARHTLTRLRTDLARRRLSRAAALRLIANVEHNLREADATLQQQHGLSLTAELHHRIGELMEVNGDVGTQIRILRHKVIQLFDHDRDHAGLTPVPHA